MNIARDLSPPPVEGLKPHFSLAVEENGFLFLSGQLPFGSDKRVKGNTVAEQTEVCLANIALILRDHGLTLADVVKTTVWLTDVADFPAFNRTYAEAFSGPRLPARSTVRADLMVEGARVEIEVIARLRSAP